MPVTSWRMPSTSAAHARRSPVCTRRASRSYAAPSRKRGDRHDGGTRGRCRARASGSRGGGRRRRRRARASSRRETPLRTRLRGGRRPCGPRAAAASASACQALHEIVDCARSAPSTSSGSIAGNSAMRSWLRPSLRYGSTSTMPLARSAPRARRRRPVSSKSIVAVTVLRAAGSFDERCRVRVARRPSRR